MDHSLVEDLNLHSWWYVPMPGSGVSHWSCQGSPRRINRICHLGWYAGTVDPCGPFEVQGPPLSPLGEALGSKPKAHTSPNTQFHLRAFTVCSSSVAPLIKYDPPSYLTDIHKRTTLTSLKPALIKDQTGSSQNATGSLLIKKMVMAPSRHLWMGQRNEDEAD